MHNCHPFGHDIDSHNRCACAGWKRAWSSEVADHRHATADTCADDCFADGACAEVFSVPGRISFNGEIAANRSRQGVRGFSERVRSATSRFKQLPPGWKFRTKVLDQDLIHNPGLVPGFLFAAGAKDGQLAGV
jgi:hypothetical protein